MQCNCVYTGSLGKDDKGVIWGSVCAEYTTGYEVAVYHNVNEWMICFPNSETHGTSNVRDVKMTTVPGTGKVQLKLPMVDERIAVMLYLHTLMMKTVAAKQAQKRLSQSQRRSGLVAKLKLMGTTQS